MCTAGNHKINKYSGSVCSIVHRFATNDEFLLALNTSVAHQVCLNCCIAHLFHSNNYVAHNLARYKKLIIMAQLMHTKHGHATVSLLAAYTKLIILSHRFLCSTYFGSHLA